MIFFSFSYFSFFFYPITATPPPVSGPGSQCLSGKGEDYRGRIATTESGNACQHWNTQFPHKHGWIPGRYPCKYAVPRLFIKYQRIQLFLINSGAEEHRFYIIMLISCFLTFCQLSIHPFRSRSSLFSAFLFFFYQLLYLRAFPRKVGPGDP